MLDNYEFTDIDNSIKQINEIITAESPDSIYEAEINKDFIISLFIDVTKIDKNSDKKNDDNFSRLTLESIRANPFDIDRLAELNSFQSQLSNKSINTCIEHLTTEKRLGQKVKPNGFQLLYKIFQEKITQYDFIINIKKLNESFSLTSKEKKKKTEGLTKQNKYIADYQQKNKNNIIDRLKQKDKDDLESEIKVLKKNQNIIAIFYCILEYIDLVKQYNSAHAAKSAHSTSSELVYATSLPVTDSNIASASELNNAPADASNNTNGGRRYRRSHRRSHRRPTQTRRRAKNTRRRRKNARRRTIRRKY